MILNPGWTSDHLEVKNVPIPGFHPRDFDFIGPDTDENVVFDTQVFKSKVKENQIILPFSIHISKLWTGHQGKAYRKQKLLNYNF